jgi:hypothetical protein
MGGNSDKEITELKKAYETLNSLDVISEFGSERRYSDTKLADELFEKTINPALLNVKFSDNSPSIFRNNRLDAPSAWHAYFYLLRVQQKRLNFCILGNSRMEYDPNHGDHVFFRGQRCSSWEFNSSLKRKEKSVKDFDERTLVCLLEFFKYSFGTASDMASNAALCFAQHNGLPTNLMDVSCDPDVAVWFATRRGSTCPQSENNGVVRAVTWAGQRSGSKPTILIPPPFVHNVYIQHGLFLDTSETNGVLTGDKDLDIHFPRETVAGDFNVFREGSILDVWPKQTHHEMELIEWAHSIANKYPDYLAASKMAKLEVEKGNVPSYWQNKELFDLAKYKIPWLEVFLIWLLPGTCVTANYVNRYGLDGYFCNISDFKVKRLVQANPTFFRKICEFTDEIDLHGEGAAREVIRIAREELKIS